MSRGVISAEEAQAAAVVLEHHRKAVETFDLERRLAALEAMGSNGTTPSLPFGYCRHTHLHAETAQAWRPIEFEMAAILVHDIAGDRKAETVTGG